MIRRLLVGLPLAALALLVAGSAHAQATQFYPVAPCRVFDTRAFGDNTPIPGNTSRNYSVKGTCGIPNDAAAVSYNVTAVAPPQNGFLTLWPAGLAQPTVSALNYVTGQTRGNGGVVPLAAGSPDLSVFSVRTVHVIFDVTGYFK